MVDRRQGEFTIIRRGRRGTYTIGVCAAGPHDKYCSGKVHQTYPEQDLGSFAGVLAWAEASDARLAAYGRVPDLVAIRWVNAGM